MAEQIKFHEYNGEKYVSIYHILDYYKNLEPDNDVTYQKVYQFFVTTIKRPTYRMYGQTILKYSEVERDIENYVTLRRVKKELGIQ